LLNHGAKITKKNNSCKKILQRIYFLTQIVMQNQGQKLTNRKLMGKNSIFMQENLRELIKIVTFAT